MFIYSLHDQRLQSSTGHWLMSKMCIAKAVEQCKCESIHSEVGESTNLSIYSLASTENAWGSPHDFWIHVLHVKHACL